MKTIRRDSAAHYTAFFLPRIDPNGGRAAVKTQWTFTTNARRQANLTARNSRHCHGCLRRRSVLTVKLAHNIIHDSLRRLSPACGCARRYADGASWHVISTMEIYLGRPWVEALVRPPSQADRQAGDKAGRQATKVTTTQAAKVRTIQAAKVTTIR